MPIEWYQCHHVVTTFLLFSSQNILSTVTILKRSKKNGSRIWNCIILFTEEEQETPHITPTSITVFPSPRRVPLAVTVGEENVLRMDLSIEFDPSDTDSVSGSNNWKIIVWLSNQGNGNTGTRVAETEDTITTPQINKNLVAPGPLNFQVKYLDAIANKHAAVFFK